MFLVLFFTFPPLKFILILLLLPQVRVKMNKDSIVKINSDCKLLDWLVTNKEKITAKMPLLADWSCNMKKIKFNKKGVLAFILASVLLLVACGGDDGPAGIKVSEDKNGDRDNVPVVLETLASGSKDIKGKVSTIDISNIAKGYYMVKYTGSKEKIKMQVSHSGGSTYTYDLIPNGEFFAFPLSPGNGTYTITINENISGTRYAVIDTASFDVSLENEFTTFLHPNIYVDFDASTQAISLGSDLAKGAYTDLDVVSYVYEYVISNVEYDYDRAAAVDTFYLPDIDGTLDSKTGLCFDYAAVMTSMLRSQRIPTQLVIGYAGDVYHAWISVYTPETGWMNDVIQFDGEEWVMLDPTFASSSNEDPDVMQYLGDGQHYNAMYFY